MLNEFSLKASQNTLHGFSDLRAVNDHASLKIMSKGRGVWIQSEDGRLMLEASAGMWCTSLGFGDEELIEAAIEQYRTLPYYHTVAGKSVVPAAALSERLMDKSPIRSGKVYFACTGSEANDFLVKFIRYANNAVGKTRKKQFISRVNSYHGATLASASLTGLAANHRSFDLPLPGFRHVSEPLFIRHGLPGESESEFCARLVQELADTIENEDPDTIAGFFAEPVTAAGGVVIPPDGYYEGIQKVLARYDVPFIADEVVTGVGRLGTLFGCDAMDIRPGAITMGKGLTSAYFPLSAIIVNESIAEQMMKGSDENAGYFAHGTTYAGHPVGCAIALAVLDIVERRDLLTHVRQVSAVFASRIERLKQHPLVSSVRCKGLIGAVELNKVCATPSSAIPTADIAKKVHAIAEDEYGLIFRKLANNVCAFSPPLVISASEVDELFDRFTLALDRVAQQM